MRVLQAFLVLLLSCSCFGETTIPSLISVEGDTSKEKLFQLGQFPASHLRETVPRWKRGGRTSLLVFALEKGDTSLLNWLIQRDLDLNQKEGPGQRPPLFWLLKSRLPGVKKLEMCGTLLVSGANPKLTDSRNRTAFHALVSGRSFEPSILFVRTAELLKSFGCPLETEDQSGYTPLMAAIMRHDEVAVKTLLKLGSDPDRLSVLQKITARTLARQQSHTVDHPKEGQAVLKLFQKL